jgi:CBS domain containing-hemolysin-like protein
MTPLYHHLVLPTNFLYLSLDLKKIFLFGLGLILALIVIIVLSSAAESALISISPAKVRSLHEAEKPGSHYLKKLKDKQDQTLIVILVW